MKRKTTTRRKRKPTSLQSRLSKRVNLIQRSAADFLNAKFNALSMQKQKAILIAFGLMAVLACVRLVVHTGDHYIIHSISQDTIQEITLPKAYGQERKAWWEIFSLLDSLRQTPFGKHWYDSLSRTHPGLEDSLTRFFNSIK